MNKSLTYSLLPPTDLFLTEKAIVLITHSISSQIRQFGNGRKFWPSVKPLKTSIYWINFYRFFGDFCKETSSKNKATLASVRETLFLHITSPDATRFELTIAEGFINGWTKRLTFQILFTVSINKIYGGVSSGKNKVRNVLTF